MRMRRTCNYMMRGFTYDIRIIRDSSYLQSLPLYTAQSNSSMRGVMRPQPSQNRAMSPMPTISMKHFRSRPAQTRRGSSGRPCRHPNPRPHLVSRLPEISLCAAEANLARTPPYCRRDRAGRMARRCHHQVQVPPVALRVRHECRVCMVHNDRLAIRERVERCDLFAYEGSMSR